MRQLRLRATHTHDRAAQAKHKISAEALQHSLRALIGSSYGLTLLKGRNSAPLCCQAPKFPCHLKTQQKQPTATAIKSGQPCRELLPKSAQSKQVVHRANFRQDAIRKIASPRTPIKCTKVHKSAQKRQVTNAQHQPRQWLRRHFPQKHTTPPFQANPSIKQAARTMEADELYRTI